MPAAASVLPTSNQLDALLGLLRQADYKIGPDQMACAQKILLLAHAEAETGSAARRLKTMLAPIVARTAAQQADFYRKFDALLERIVPAPAPSLTGSLEVVHGDPIHVGPETIAGLEPKRQRPRSVVAAVVVTLLLMLAEIVWIVRPQAPGPIPPSSQPPTTSIPDITAKLEKTDFTTATSLRRPGYGATQAGAIALPMLVFAGWMAWRWRHRVLWFEVRDVDLAMVRLPEEHQPLFPAAKLTSIALDLRRHVRVWTRDLDFDRTIPETLDAGGSFTPAWQTIPRSPSYLFLIERESVHDHVAGILDRAIDRLADEHIAIDRYFFRDDPRWLSGSNGIEHIADMAARRGDQRLVLLTDADGFFKPLTNRLDPSIERELAQWIPRAVLSTKPMQNWSWRELALRDQGGFDVATATHRGLRALAERAVAEPDRQAELLDGVVVSMPARPSLRRRVPQAAALRPSRKTTLLETSPGAIFISYAEEDRLMAGRLSNFLESEVGVDSWRRPALAGEDWYERGRQQIIECAYFIPVLSANAIFRRDSFLRREWEWAAERARSADPSIPFILPVVIDNTRKVAGEMPQVFLRVQWSKFPDGIGNWIFRDRMVELMLEYRSRPSNVNVSKKF